MDMVSETIGQRLRDVRGSVSMTQAEFASKMQVSTTTVTRYEGDNTIPDGSFLLKLKTLFDVDPSWVLLGKASDVVLEDVVSLDDYKIAIQTISSVIANLKKKGSGVADT